MIKQAVVDKVREFYLAGYDESGLVYDERAYAREVISHDKSRFRASAKWLVRRGAITEAQTQVLERLYAHRREIADAELFGEALAALRSILLDAGRDRHRGVHRVR